ncbi:S8 family serine peptidase [Desulfosporosinus sp. PR]|uniref:S8 family serine peptidase n=1 Tax=Candidatus Desulfosporosinus nitrosoreducens TaxID=3401928 RepID=UPI0027FE158B|nr:S8 family serine peptidase [Desulfosporosinus sp. PR]MDQ7092367.1 S8 family serine peptidase [Desulfosporosinus sp. PR]
MAKRKIAVSALLIVILLAAGFILLKQSGSPPSPKNVSLKSTVGQNQTANINTPPAQGASTQSVVNPKYSNEDQLTPENISNQVVVKLSSGTDPEKLAQTINAEIVRKGPLQYITLALPKNQYASIIERLKKTAGVLSVQPVRILKTTTVKTMSVNPTDSLYPQQWGLTKIEAQKAWNLGFTGNGITVAVVDTGVDLNHPDLKDNILPGYNAITGVTGGTTIQDNNGHGTHVSGIIAAEANGIGVVGVAYQAKILPVKALTKQGEGTDDCIADGITWAADHSAKIINLSLGSDSESDVLKEALQYAADKGCLIVAAGGNLEDNLTTISYPAADPLVLAVTATDSNDQIASFSLPGPQAGLAAPGVNIASDYWQNSSGYASLDGTSMASPFVAGAAALVWSAHPDLNAQQVRVALENSARDLGAAGRDNSYGFGRVDAYWAVRFADKSPAFSSPANLDWAGGTVQGGTSTTSVTLTVPARTFGLDPSANVTVSIGPASDAAAFPSGILPLGDAVSLQWNSSVKKFLGLTLSTTGSTPSSNRVGYIFHWSGSRWILTGGGLNAAAISTAVTEPGIYRVGFVLPPENHRLAGNDQIQTSLQISQTEFPYGADTVLLATADDFSDALSGVPLAYKLHAPILLTPPEQLPAALKTEIQRLAPQKIILLGGTAVISTNIEQQLQSAFSVQRLAGVTRFGTAAQIASALGTIGQAVLVNGTSFPDAISIASLAAQQGIPILLTDTNSLPTETDAIMRQLLISQTTVGGGEAVVSSTLFSNLPTPARLAGYDRYDTAAAILQAFPPQGNLLFVATGENYPDALSGGVIAAMNQSGLLLVPLTGPNSAETSLIQSWHGKTVYVFGGTAVVPDEILQQVQSVVR